ncbi:2OG-Fe(II) oxygenase [Phenylobacterium sp. LjRoot219]|uniref:2OG-Fe(II) oxygenase n=1 Tax=Phenylobacterium sp. LjRoot219 TaxID=3342283 RepID=UPI003ED07A46
MSLIPGTPAPLFTAPSPVNPRFAFGSLGGRYLLLLFLPEPSPEREAALAAVAERRRLLSDERLLVFGVLPDAASFAAAEQAEDGIRWFHDPEGQIRRLYGAADGDGRLSPQVVAIDPSMRILGALPLADTAAVLERVAALGAPEAHAGTTLHAPVLIVPRVLEPSFCRQLIACYDAAGGSPSGVMQERDGRTVGVFNFMKRRMDAAIPDGPLQQQLRARLVQRLLPEIEKAFQFRAGYIERYIVACYDAEGGGFFLPHRDNTTPGTAHRRFAVSINLNAEEFEGGDLRFPEFGRRTYRPPTGGAVVFSCSLLHEATPVTRGRRYATLPFLYDEAGAKVREANLHTMHEVQVLT